MTADPKQPVAASTVQSPDLADKKLQVEFASVDAKYFTTFGVRMLNGRGIDATDRGFQSAVGFSFLAPHFPFGVGPLNHTVRCGPDTLQQLPRFGL